MQDQPTIGIPACFTSPTVKQPDHEDPTPTTTAAAVTRSGQSVFMSVYRTKLADHCRLVTVTWCKNLLQHGLSVSVEGPEGESQCTCKVELKPWSFWRKQGSKRFMVDGSKEVEIFWDLKAAKFNGETEPASDYYVAVVCDEEVVLLLGDLKKDAYRKTGCRPALVDPVLVSRKEHVFCKKRFCTKLKFHEKGRFHEISIECKNGRSNNDTSNGIEPEMEIKLDGRLVIHVKHLQWKFRGNECIQLKKLKLEVYWDVHDWLFSPGLRHALFIFKPILMSPSTASLSSLTSTISTSSSSPPLSCSLTSSPLSSRTVSRGSLDGFSNNAGGSSDFCFFLYAWKVE